MMTAWAANLAANRKQELAVPGSTKWLAATLLDVNEMVRVPFDAHFKLMTEASAELENYRLAATTGNVDALLLSPIKPSLAPREVSPRRPVVAKPRNPLRVSPRHQPLHTRPALSVPRETTQRAAVARESPVKQPAPKSTPFMRTVETAREPTEPIHKPSKEPRPTKPTTRESAPDPAKLRKPTEGRSSLFVPLPQREPIALPKPSLATKRTVSQRALLSPVKIPSEFLKRPTPPLYLEVPARRQPLLPLSSPLKFAAPTRASVARSKPALRKASPRRTTPRKTNRFLTTTLNSSPNKVTASAPTKSVTTPRQKLNPVVLNPRITPKNRGNAVALPTEARGNAVPLPTEARARKPTKPVERAPDLHWRKLEEDRYSAETLPSIPDDVRQCKVFAEWAESPNVRKQVREQRHTDPREIFPPMQPFDGHEVFADHPSRLRGRPSPFTLPLKEDVEREERIYARHMGYRP